MNPTPLSLASLRRYARSVVPPELLLPGGRWVHGAELRRWRLAGRDARPESWGRRLLKLAQPFLCGFADDPACRRGRPRWNNPGWCAPAPYGTYHWAFHAEMVECVCRLPRAFRAGAAFGRDPSEPFRDANPYRSTSEASTQWDCGYILGLAWDKVADWLAKRGAA